VSDRDGGLTCGEGPGAAGVVEGTISPSKRLAFAWRVPGRLLAEAPEADVESLLIRLSDGAVLSSAPGLYWRTGGARANHIDEGAVWSPNSRFAIAVTDAKWSTEHLRLYAIRGDDKVLVLDLKAIIEPAVRKRLQRLVKNESIYVFSAFGLAVDNRGLVEAPVLRTRHRVCGHAPSRPQGCDARRPGRGGPPLPRRTLAAPKLRERL
jgi:hypothetical protein